VDIAYYPLRRRATLTHVNRCYVVPGGLLRAVGQLGNRPNVGEEIVDLIGCECELRHLDNAVAGQREQSDSAILPPTIGLPCSSYGRRGENYGR